MKKNSRPGSSTRANSGVARRLRPLIEQVRALVQTARQAAATSVNAIQVQTNFEIGRLIVNHEQEGHNRAVYGKETLKQMSTTLTAEFGRGFSETNLKLMRQFYLLWRGRDIEVSQTLADELPAARIRQKPSDELTISQALPAKLSATKIGQNPSDESLGLAKAPPGKDTAPFILSWSHYVLLASINDPSERSFYEIEAANSGWSLPELKRQVASSLYERLAVSVDKKRVCRLAEQGHTIVQPTDLLREPYVLEFLGLEEKPAYSEEDLEAAIIDKLQHFLLELGKGFLFEARQKRFTFGDDHYFVDLVFYNRLLRAYVLLDLKIGKLTHQDLGQMQMYVNHFDRYVKLEDEHPTVGIILCKRKNEALVEITLPAEANIYASEYRLYLPSKKELRLRLMEWSRTETEKRPSR